MTNRRICILNLKTDRKINVQSGANSDYKLKTLRSKAGPLFIFGRESDSTRIYPVNDSSFGSPHELN
jgi:hypothetical protein